MINKKYLTTIIDEEFPDLKKTRFKLNGQALRRFTENTLLPFLIYQNTTDSKNRLIQLYLQESSASKHFLPFYIALGFYRKAIDSLFSSQDFKSSRYKVGSKQVTLNGSVCSITNINFINKSITLRHGTGLISEIPMVEDYKLSWRYPKALDLRRKLSKFDNLVGVSDHNLFSLPIPKNDKNHEGILVFTQISKFETLLRNLTVSNSCLNDYISVHRTVFDKRAQQISFRQISSAKTKGRQPTVLASRISDLFAYQQILSAGKGQYNHLKTVIIEDFDLELRAWERNGTLAENLQAMDEIYFSKLGKGIKDIYLVFGNRSFDLHPFLKRNKINPMTWLLTPQEASELDGLGKIKEVLVKEFFDPTAAEIIAKLEQQILLWKSLSVQYFCLGQTLEVIGRLYGIRDKLTSFYSPFTFLDTIQELGRFLVILQRNWFSSGQDYGLISQTIEILNITTSIKGNPAEHLISEILSSINENHTLITIVTNNKDKGDHDYLASLPSAKGISIRFFTSKQLLAENVEHFIQSEKLIYLVWNKEVVNNLLTKFSLPEQLFLISSRGHQFVKNYSKSAWKTISSISSTKEKYSLLNVEPSDNDGDNPAFPSNIIFIDRETAEPYLGKEVVPLPELEDTLMHIVSRISVQRIKGNRDEAFVNVLFEDGSHLVFGENQLVFCYDEENNDALSDLQKEAKNLEANDLIIVPKSKVEIKKLLNEALSGNEVFASYVSSDHEWRAKLGNYILRSTSDLSRFRESLKLNGIKVEADITIRNWVEGETLEPRNFSNLLLALSNMHILEIEKTSVYLAGAKILKRLKSTFIRTAMHKLIYNLKGIHVNADSDLFDAELLNGFLDHVEMKKVLIVIGGTHAD
jgi:hypothetical protein